MGESLKGKVLVLLGLLCALGMGLQRFKNCRQPLRTYMLCAACCALLSAAASYCRGAQDCACSLRLISETLPPDLCAATQNHHTSPQISRMLLPARGGAQLRCPTTGNWHCQGIKVRSSFLVRSTTNHRRVMVSRFRATS